MAAILTMIFPSDAILIFAGCLAGYIDTIAGGSGLITLPAFLMAGLPPHIALGTNKLAGTLSVGNAARIFIKKKIFQPRYWPAAMIATFSGGVTGTLLVQLVSGAFLKQFLPVIILGLGFYVAIPKQYPPLTQTHYQPKRFSSSVLGVILGFYDGFIGPGVGSFWAVALMGFYKIPLVEATGVAKLMNFLSNAAALITFIIFGAVDYPLGLMVGAAMMLGSFLGAQSAIRWGAPLVRPLFLIIVFSIGIVLAWQSWLH